MPVLLLCGQDSVRYGECLQATLGEACALLSVGSDPNSPSLETKGGCPNEDALLIMHHQERSLVAVADGHFGTVASHRILDRIAERCPQIPRNGRELMLLLLDLSEPPVEGSSGTTLVLVVYDRAKRRGFGISFGDSTAVLLDKECYQQLNEHNSIYLGLNQPLPIEQGCTFRFGGESGVLLLFTDGVNECHYEDPQSSVKPEHVQRLFRQHDGVQSFVSALATLALEGVDGNPGGQDNLAITAMPL